MPSYNDEESAPLLGAGGDSGQARTAANGGDGDLGSGSTVVVSPMDELSPPTYQSVTGGQPMVICRVCQTSIDISGKRDQHVVKCNACNEATPIRNAPHGRQYVRCPCNCLLICKNNSKRISCPRPNCKRVISLAPSEPVTAPAVPNVPGMCRVNCAHCHDNFLFNTLTNALARCPHCRKISSVGDFSKKRGLLFAAVGMVVLIIALATTLGAWKAASEKSGLYVVFIGLFAFALALLARGIYYLTMKVSWVDGPV